MSLLDKVKSWFKHAAVAVSGVFAKLVGHDNAVAFGHAALGLLKSALGVIVTDAVAAAESFDPNASGEAKKAHAFAKILEDSKAQGIQVSNSLVSMLIELAVGVLKGNFHPA